MRLPRRERCFVVVTSWDDGHILDLKLAEMLEKYGVKGTFFVPSRDRGVIEKQGLDDDSLRYLSEIGEVGSHTVSHPNLVNLDSEKAFEEIMRSKHELEAIVGKRIVGFCYPRSRYDERIKNLVVQAGYEYARVVDDFSFSIISSGEFEVKTTLEAHRRSLISRDTAKRVASDFRIAKYLRDFGKWDLLAIRVFDHCWKNGNVFHLWGHSWDIEKSRDWGRLDRVLDYVSKRDATEYLTLQQYVQMTCDGNSHPPK
jgi:peptidoglycan/xylan/chitin deacetylase (PgdA/CDA1 family)